MYAALLAYDANKNCAAGESKLSHYMGPLKDEIPAAFAPAAEQQSSAARG